MKKLILAVGMAAMVAMTGCGGVNAVLAAGVGTVPAPVIVVSTKTLLDTEHGFSVLQASYLSANAKGAFKTKPELKAGIKMALDKGSIALDAAGEALAAAKDGNFVARIQDALAAINTAKSLLAKAAT